MLTNILTSQRYGHEIKKSLRAQNTAQMFGHVGELNTEKFFDLFFDFWYRVVSGAKPSNRNSIFINDKFCEIPLDGVDQHASLLRLQVLEKRMSIAAIDVDLIEHVELDIVTSSELFDFGVCSGFLSSELIARKCQNGQPPIFRAVLLIHLDQLGVVDRRLASLACNIYYDGDLAAVFVQTYLISIDGLGCEVVDRTSGIRVSLCHDRKTF